MLNKIDKLRPIFGLTVALLITSPALSADQFGQEIPPYVDKSVEQAKQLRLPYNKSSERAKADAAKAVQTLEEVVKTRPNYYRALFNLGLAYDQAGDFTKANENFEKAIAIREKLNIKDISLLNSAGWVSMSNGDYATAEKRLLLALKNIDQGEPFTQSAIYNNLGLLYFYTQRFEKAKQYLSIAKDRFSSKSAAATLEIIEKTNEIIDNKQMIKN